MNTDPLWTRRRFLLCAATAAGGALLSPPRLAAFARSRPPLGVLRIGLVAASGAMPAAFGAADGVRLGIDEAARTAALFGRRVELVQPPSATSDPAAAARGLVDAGAHVLLSALAPDATAAAASVAEERRVPLLNLAASADELRGEQCARFLFHLAPSDAMRADAVVRWLASTRKPRSISVIVDSDAARAKTADRVEAALRAQGVTVAPRAVVAPPADGAVATSTAGSGAVDAVVLIADARSAASFVGGWNRTDAVLVDLSDAARSEGAPTGGGEVVRAVAWSAALERFGADQLNQRFQRRYGRGMDDAAWAGWAAVKTAWEAAMRGNAGDGAAIAAYLADGRAELDGQKGWPLSFRPWDRQLRQPLYLVSSGGNAAPGRVVGEVPGGERGGGDSAAALDVLGVGRAESACQRGGR
jgi:ABC transporter substrate binding protein (PQQ-dependent alcohol dehydrogenase system)